MAQIKVESGKLASLAWSPRAGDYPLDLDGSQRFSRPAKGFSAMPYPSMIGGIPATGVLYDIWAFTRGNAPTPSSFYLGGSGAREIGFTGQGVEGNPANLPKLRG